MTKEKTTEERMQWVYAQLKEIEEPQQKEVRQQKEQRQQMKAKRERIFKLFDRGLGVPLTIFMVLWLVGGSVLTLLATFAGSALTLGLLGWPVAIIGFGITFGVAWLVFEGFTRTGDSLQKWAADAERDPEEEARGAARLEVYRKRLTGKN